MKITNFVIFSFLYLDFEISYDQDKDNDKCSNLILAIKYKHCNMVLETEQLWLVSFTLIHQWIFQPVFCDSRTLNSTSVCKNFCFEDITDSSILTTERIESGLNVSNETRLKVNLSQNVVLLQKQCFRICCCTRLNHETIDFWKLKKKTRLIRILNLEV